uniref:Uncharacterized protein n=1 Tax=Setaria viridis TaxID=4556 RepID=A0A4U6VHN6_SETVI|nr:hypothetical protein SEVIR_3G375250v2 [Setaria viridis]
MCKPLLVPKIPDAHHLGVLHVCTMTWNGRPERWESREPRPVHRGRASKADDTGKRRWPYLLERSADVANAGASVAVAGLLPCGGHWSAAPVAGVQFPC